MSPTPEEARAALHQVGDQQAAARRGAEPRWALAVLAVLALALGVSADLGSDLHLLVYCGLAAFALVLTAASRSRRLGGALGYRRAPAPDVSWGGRVARLAVGAVLALLLAAGLRAADVPFPTTIGMALLAVLIFGWEPLRARLRRRTHG
ncbi:hypothetical protein AB8O55_25460 [Saccharopolyspora cebuensis]|uniref:Uncharacterized protein n=2 Tax=Saccharopolyspora cebuensis TaxID=418759 RepID=A0ABV4CQH9_9PSEU